ncbi:GGDEF domain-containing protein [Roseibium algae]|uniref:diguanylate cyclase n=1 Tax=Roseibium algae TaxID=3123038 RepID=A0ABU8TIP5_9HYPH
MHLDTPTLLAAAAISCLAGAIVLGVLSAAMRSFPNNLRLGWGLWSFALVISSAGLIMVGLRGTISDIFSIAIANMFVTFGYGIRPNALSLFHGRGPSYPWLPFVAAFGWLGLYLFPWFRDDLTLRVIYINSLCILSIALCILECWKQRNEQQFSSWLLIGIFGVDISLRATLILMHTQTAFPNFKATLSLPIMQILIVILIITIILEVVGLGVAAFEKMKTQIEMEALLDPLTGLPNRRSLGISAQADLDRRPDQGQVYTLLVLEIDNMQAITSRFGNSMGDAFIKLLGRLCNEAIGKRASVGYIRENQFSVYLPKTDQVEAGAIATRISRTLTVQSSNASGNQLAITISCGMFCGHTETSFERALEHADKSLSQAKAQGGNQIVANHSLKAGPQKSKTMSSPFAPRNKSVA